MVNGPFMPGPARGVQPTSQGVAPAVPQGAGTFAEKLKEAQQKSSPGGLMFSAHARARMAERSITLSNDDLARIDKAADVAASKGSRESLFLLDKLGLIVNVRNRTVLTAVDPERLREGIVTNIDSTVLISGTQE